MPKVWKNIPNEIIKVLLFDLVSLILQEIFENVLYIPKLFISIFNELELISVISLEATTKGFHALQKRVA